MRDLCCQRDCGNAFEVVVQISIQDKVTLTSLVCAEHIETAFRDLAEQTRGTIEQGLEFLERGIITYGQSLERYVDD